MVFQLVHNYVCSHFNFYAFIQESSKQKLKNVIYSEWSKADKELLFWR